MLVDHVIVELCQMTQDVNVGTLWNGGYITILMMSSAHSVMATSRWEQVRKEVTECIII